MKALTVKQLAAVSGVTVRTLHHYDEIGLLKPAYVGANGYRYYERAEMLRLQRILVHRELGVGLAEIATLMELEGGDQLALLQRHRERLEEQHARFARLIDTIDRTIANLKGEDTMSNADLYKGFSAEKQADYETWLVERHGEPMRASVVLSREAHGKLSEADRAGLMEALKSIEEALAKALRQGVTPEAETVAGLIARHRAWVATMWGKECLPTAYQGLADMYLAHPDFQARYEAIAPGFTDWLVAAMKAHAAA